MESARAGAICAATPNATRAIQEIHRSFMQMPPRWRIRPMLRPCKAVFDNPSYASLTGPSRDRQPRRRDMYKRFLELRRLPDGGGATGVINLFGLDPVGDSARQRHGRSGVARITSLTLHGDIEISVALEHKHLCACSRSPGRLWSVVRSITYAAQGRHAGKLARKFVELGASAREI